MVEPAGPFSTSASSTSDMKSYHGSSLEWPLEVDFRVPSVVLVEITADIVAVPAAAAAEAASAAAPCTVNDLELLPVP